MKKRDSITRPILNSSLSKLAIYFILNRRDKIIEKCGNSLHMVAIPSSYDKFGGINWAGYRHPRLHFNREKDELKEWTNVLFRA